MEAPPALEADRNWRMAVWSLRAGYGALVVTLVGVVVLSSGSTPWVLGAGVLAWLALAAVTLTGVVRAHDALPEPRPGYWPLRFLLIRDTVHARPTTPPA